MNSREEKHELILKEAYTAAEQAALQSLKLKLARSSLSADHTMMRFLRARGLDVQLAFEMYVMAHNWRKTNEVDGQYARPPPMERLLKLAVPQELHGHDRGGRPVLIQKIGQMHLSTFIKFDPEIVNQCHIHQMEMLMKACEENSQRFRKRVTQVTIVVDAKGLGLSHRKAIQFSRGTSFIDKNYYPETLHQLIFINAPAIAPALWKIAKPMMDPSTQQKVLILGRNYHAKLHEIIAPEQLPKEYGGQCQCEERGGCVPEVPAAICKEAFKSEYSSTKKLSPKLNEIVIGARGSHTVEVEIGNPLGQEVSYLFSTSKNDIGFAVEFLPFERQPVLGAGEAQHLHQHAAAENEQKKRTLKAQLLLENVRYACPPDDPMTGSVRPNCAGICRFVFDNSFSRFTSKQLFFHVSVEDDDADGARTPSSSRSLSRHRFQSLDTNADSDEEEELPVLEVF